MSKTAHIPCFVVCSADTPVHEVDVFMRTPPATSDMLCKRLVCSLSDSEMTVIAKQQQEIVRDFVYLGLTTLLTDSFTSDR